jgi:hypothetical protein
MTVCTAAIFLWFYPDETVGPAIITASDRMLSDIGLGIEYESSRWKVGVLGTHHMILVAGALSFNSLAVSQLTLALRDNPAASTYDIASLYGSIVSKLAFERAFKRILSPLGVQADTHNGLKGIEGLNLDSSLLLQLSDQMQAETIDCEAIIVGCDARECSLFRVDSRGIVARHDDIGFVSIGTGGIHASGYLMQEPYDHRTGFNEALLTVFLAKKRAELAPGVGRETDMFFVNGDGVNKVDERIMGSLERCASDIQKSKKSQLKRLTKRIASTFAGLKN